MIGCAHGRRHTWERGSIAVEGRTGGDEGISPFVSLLLELFRINLIGDFLPFD